MKQIIKIIHFLNKKSSIKMLAVILIVGILFFHHAYAADEANILNDTRDFLDKALGFLSRVWIFLAIIAGKFMTNDVVYGAFMNLDKYLRAIRNVMKNFANFGLAFMILYSIIKYVIDKKGGGDDPKKIVVKALIAGVLIQVSRFMVGALVDLSTVATAAVAAFPSNFIGNDHVITSVQTEVQTMLANPQYIAKIEDGKFKREQAQPRSDGGSCVVDGVDAIMPKYDSVSGPLIFIGMSFFKVQNYMNHGVLPDTLAGGGQLIVNLALKVLILLAYVGCLIGLVIANLIRVLFLWLLIMISPIAVLMGVFEKKIEGQGFMKYFNIQTFLDLIFKPLFFIGFIGLTLIFVTSMQQIMGGDKGIQDMGGVSISSNTGATTINMEGIADFTVNGDVFGNIADDSKTVFVDLMLIFMTLLLLRQMLKRSVEFGSGPVQDVLSKITPLVESLAGTLPVIPTPGGEPIGLSGLLQASQKSTQKVLEEAGIKGTGSEKGTFFNNEKDFRNQIYKKFFNLKNEWDTIKDTRKLEQMIKNDDDSFRPTFISTGKNTSEGVSLSNKEQFTLVEKWFNHNRVAHPDKITKLFPGVVSTDTKMEDYFGKDDTNGERRKKLHELLGGYEHMENKKSGTPASFDEIKNNRYRYEPTTQ